MQRRGKQHDSHAQRPGTHPYAERKSVSRQPLVRQTYWKISPRCRTQKPKLVMVEHLSCEVARYLWLSLARKRQPLQLC